MDFTDLQSIEPQWSWSYRRVRLSLRVALTIVSSVLVANCGTTYQPLSEGSPVPWAKAKANSSNSESIGTGRSSFNRVSPATAEPGAQTDAPDSGKAPHIQTAKPVPLVLKPLVPTPLQQPKVDIDAYRMRYDLLHDGKPIKGKLYIVRLDENLATIAAQHNISLEELVAANNIKPPYRIEEGRSPIIIIPHPHGKKFTAPDAGYRSRGGGPVELHIPVKPISESDGIQPG